MDQDRCEEALEVYRELVSADPQSRWASRAASRIKMGACLLTEENVFERQNEGCGAIPRTDARADCFFRSREYVESRVLYESLSQKKGLKKKKELFYLVRLSQAAARSQDFETAIEANRKVRALYPKTREALEALRKIAFLQQDSGHYGDALVSLKELVGKTRSQQEGRVYQERMGWCHYRLGESDQALPFFENALETAETPSVLYWKARVLEKKGLKRAAKEIYRSLIDYYAGNYYGVRSLERLYGRNSSPQKILTRWWPDSVSRLKWRKQKERLKSSSDLEKIQELKEVGLLQDAEIEIRRLRLKEDIVPPLDLGRLRRVKEGFEIISRTPAFEHADYSLPHADFVFSAIEQTGHEIDPFLVYAMMRQESHYRDWVESPVGAIGLLQIMPFTGRRLAREAGWGDDYEVRWLREPRNNIELSLRYLEKLWILFDGRWYAVVASYNAGEQVVAQWLSQKPGLSEEEFIEEIPYSETREYVKKIYANWKAYRYIYGAR